MKSPKDLKKVSREGGKKARATATVALATLEQKNVTPLPQAAGWTWTKRKREAVKLFCTGAHRTTIAKVLGVDRRTIYRWCQAPEFAQACRDWAAEEHRVRKGKRVKSIGILSDTVKSLLGNQLQDLTKMQEKAKGFALDKEAIAQLSLLFRENRELYAQEREEFGEATQRIQGEFHHVMMPGATTVTETQRQQTKGVGSESFASYLRQHGDPALLKQAINADNPVSALIAAGRSLASNPELLSQVFDTTEEKPK